MFIIINLIILHISNIPYLVSDSNDKKKCKKCRLVVIKLTELQHPR